MKRKFKMPKMLRFRRKKLRATAVRRPLRIGATTAEYGDLAEPSMKLSRALLIVLLLHVVAVAGIIAFNAIKTRQSPAVSSAAPASSPVRSTVGVPVTATSAAEIKRAQPVGNLTDGSHKTYVVAKGDNPVTIAKKFKVSYDDLLALNHIDDPRKLKIGQKLLIPDKIKTAKKGD
jgi:LysM repeat protein